MCNIKTLLSIAMVLAMSTATVERLLSDIKWIKDHLRNRLLSASISKLMMIIDTEGPPLAKIDFDAVLSLWKSMRPRNDTVSERKESKKHIVRYLYKCLTDDVYVHE